VKNNPPFPTDISKLLSEWRQERAFRVVHVISRIGFALATLSTAVDLYYQIPALALSGDLLLLLGLAISIFLSHPKSKFRTSAWWPMYVGLWVCFSASIATTGGLNSPFFSGYWALLFLAGLLIQVRISPSIVTFFILANISAWAWIDARFPQLILNDPTSSTFVFIGNFLMLGTISIFVSEFLKTERDLGQELLRRYEELNRTREDLNRQEEANAAKSTFLANISHELRTPLGAILGYAELMQASDIQAQQKEKFADTIHRNAVQLSRLVDDLLDLSKAEAGKIEIENSEFKLKSAVYEVIDLLQISAQQKNISFDVNFQDPLPENIHSDPLRLKQILRNIIGNSIKFTSEGFVRVVVSLIPGSDSEFSLQIEIEDSGCGLSADEQKRIFKAFSQGDPSATRKFGGTGLGLSLSRNLARLLGGDLRLAWSQKNVGSCFVLQLPLPEARARIEKETMHEFFAPSPLKSILPQNLNRDENFLSPSKGPKPQAQSKPLRP
jgi:signal transduction histidine kinase